jgi:hypothetical protein
MEIQHKLAADVGYSPEVQPSRRKSRFFQVYTMTAPWGKPVFRLTASSGSVNGGVVVGIGKWWKEV